MKIYVVTTADFSGAYGAETFVDRKTAEDYFMREARGIEIQKSEYDYDYIRCLMSATELDSDGDVARDITLFVTNLDESEPPKFKQGDRVIVKAGTKSGLGRLFEFDTVGIIDGSKDKSGNYGVNVLRNVTNNVYVSIKEQDLELL